MKDIRTLIAKKIQGYSVFLVLCANGSYYSGMCDNLNKKIKQINARLEPYFKSHPERVPVTVVFHEDHVPFKEAYVKHRYLRSLTKRHRVKMAKTGKWPLGKEIRIFLRTGKINN
jgi:predicted GIY-YIG superfamily endonuclease